MAPLESKKNWNAWNFFICYMVSLGQIAFGYPASIIGVTLAQPSFLIDMGLLDVTKTPAVMKPNADQLIGAMSGVCSHALVHKSQALPSFKVPRSHQRRSTCTPRTLPFFLPPLPEKLTRSKVFQAGAAINVFLAGYIADRWGRKAAFHWCGLLSLFGGAMLCGARDAPMFIVARFFAGAGSWGFLAISTFDCLLVIVMVALTRASTIILCRIGTAWPARSDGRDEWCQHCAWLCTCNLCEYVPVYSLFR